MVGRAGRRKNGPTTTKLLSMIWGCKTDLHTKFLPNRTNLAKVIHLYRFLAVRLVGPVCIIQFQKSITIHCVFIRYSGLQKIKQKSQGIKKLFHFLLYPTDASDRLPPISKRRNRQYSDIFPSQYDFKQYITLRSNFFVLIHC